MILIENKNLECGFSYGLLFLINNCKLGIKVSNVIDQNTINWIIYEFVNNLLIPLNFVFHEHLKIHRTGERNYFLRAEDVGLAVGTHGPIYTKHLHIASINNRNRRINSLIFLQFKHVLILTTLRK